MTRLLAVFFLCLFFHSGLHVLLFADDVVVQTLIDLSFNENRQSDHGWTAERQSRMFIKEQMLCIEAQRGNPEIFRRVNFSGGDFRLIVELRTKTESNLSLYWTTKGSPRQEVFNAITLPLNDDGNWHTYEFVFKIPDILESITLLFSTTDGSWDIRSVKLIRSSPPPLYIQKIIPYQLKGENGKPSQEMIRFTVANGLSMPINYRIARQPEELTLPDGETVDLGVPIHRVGHLAAVVLTLQPQDFPDVVFPLFLYSPEGDTVWIRKTVGDKIIEFAPNGRMARLIQNGEVFGIIAPLVHRSGIIPNFILKEDSTETILHFESDDADLLISIAPPFVHFEITDKTEQAASDQEELPPLEGPAVRLFGSLQSGLLPGIEFLGKGDTSSSEKDIAPPYHDRSRPNKRWLTMPFAALETEKGGAALYWDDPSLQPTFSSPNRFDHTEDHRFSLIGSSLTRHPIKSTLELFSSTHNTTPHETASFRAIRSYIARKGFPPPPNTLRTIEQQNQLSMQALESALQSEIGGEWGYAFEPEWQRKPFVDMISTSARLTEAAGGRLRSPNVLVPGCSDITNDAIFFLSDRIFEWQQHREASIRQILSNALPDGSFLFRTRFPEWESASSSFGYTALQTVPIMEYAQFTGNDELFTSVTKALKFLESCEIPCGGFYRDTPFHTPDLQTAAALVWLYVWAYEYSNNADYLERAKHFALAGLPFIYQISHEDHVLYGSVGKFGGTNRRLPLHFGIINTRIGIQYAYALNLLSKHDSQTDWGTVASGILHATENLQYTSGAEAGCLPELFDIMTQKPQGWKVNPCALVSLRWAIEGKVDSLFVLVDGKDRYTAPYPLRKTPQGIEAYLVPAGQRFYILHNSNHYGEGEGNGIIRID